MGLRAIGLAAALGLVFPVAGVAAPSAAERVILLANADAPDSLAIAEHYAKARGVPEANIIALRMPLEEAITWPQFIASIWEPLEETLVERGWIDAIPMDLVDRLGRKKFAVSGHRIAALIVCRGVPLKIMHDPELFEESKPMTDHPEFRTNQGAVDSELSLLAQPGYPINASVPNPLFGEDAPSDVERQLVVEVSRLDGPTAHDAQALVDRALTAERTGLIGRAYVDIAGPHETGNRWLESVVKTISDLGYDLSVHRGAATLGVGVRFDAPALYFGWYAPDINGPFLLPGFRFPRGAVAVHIHSYSAHTLRSDTDGWCGPLVARGVTATLGNVFEPYLEHLHRPDLFMAALARGDTLVDAAYYALPELSWQSIVIGDPLYRPFPKGGNGKPTEAPLPELAGYAVIRRMNQLDAEGRHAEATAAGKEGMRDWPNLALALAYGSRLATAGVKDQAAWIVSEAAQRAGDLPGDWELLREAAVFLEGERRFSEADAIDRRLFAIDALPDAARAQWAPDARAAALAAGDVGLAAELLRLIPSPAPGR